MLAAIFEILLEFLNNIFLTIYIRIMDGLPRVELGKDVFEIL